MLYLLAKIHEFFNKFYVFLRAKKTQTPAGKILDNLNKIIESLPKEIEMPANAIRTYKILVPCGYSPAIKIEGKIGGAPDVGIISSFERCYRRHLPHFLDDLVFVFTSAPQNIQSIYYLNEFFVVAEDILNFFKRNCDLLEYRLVKTRFEDGSTADKSYWAVKVTNEIDCIDADNSFASPNSWMPEELKQISTLKSIISLTDDLIDQYSNAENGLYISYPNCHRVKNIKLFDDRIPDDCVIFRPKYWPGYLIIASDFAWELGRECRAFMPGWYFWTLELDNVADSYSEQMVANR